MNLKFGSDSAGSTQQLWKAARATRCPRVVVLDACFAKSMKQLAQVSAHMTPEMFREESGCPLWNESSPFT
jgi:hypothetical protein